MKKKSITPEMYTALKKALPAEAVSKHPTKTYLSSIKAIYVTERLNDVFGCGSWTIRVERIENGDKGMIVVKVILEIPEYGVYYESFGGNDNGGENSKNFDLGDAYKGASTDAITKIASYMGIGISVFKGQGNTSPAQATTPQPEVKWVTEKQFNLIKVGLMSADTELITKGKANFKALTTAPYAMKKEYKEELTNIIKSIENGTM